MSGLFPRLHPSLCLEPRLISDFIEVEIMLFPGDRIIRTKEELEAALREPNGVTPARSLWIHKDLEDEIRRLWESLPPT